MNDNESTVNEALSICCKLLVNIFFPYFFLTDDHTYVQFYIGTFLTILVVQERMFSP